MKSDMNFCTTGSGQQAIRTLQLAIQGVIPLMHTGYTSSTTRDFVLWHHTIQRVLQLASQIEKI